MSLLSVGAVSDGCAVWAHHGRRGPNFAAPDNGYAVIIRIWSSAMNLHCSRRKRLPQSFHAGFPAPVVSIKTMDLRVA